MTEQDESTLLAGLRALRENSAGEGASSSVGDAVLAEFRAKVKPKRKQVLRWWALAAAAGILVACFTLYTSRTRPPVTVARVEPVAPVPAITTPEAPPQKPVIAERHRRPRARIAKPRSVSPEAKKTEVATDFLPVMSAPPLEAGEHAAVVRVELPRSSLRNFGLPSSEEWRTDRVSADVVLGQDGLIRAVRFVR